jgi:hypothetical protein
LVKLEKVEGCHGHFLQIIIGGSVKVALELRQQGEKNSSKKRNMDEKLDYLLALEYED